MASFHSSRLSDFEMKWLLSSLLFQLAVISTAKIASPEPLASAGTARWRVILNCKVAGNPVVVEVRVTWEQGDAQRFTAEASRDRFSTASLLRSTVRASRP
jgi:hypothetical protein